MDNRGIVSLIFWNTKKEADKGVEDKNDLPKTSKCQFSHAKAMQKMDDYLAGCFCQLEARPEICYNSPDFVSILLRNDKDLSNKLLFFHFLEKVPILIKLFMA